jgi:hypothetical protein
MNTARMFRVAAELLFSLVVVNPAGLIAKRDAAGMFTF